jgi:ATP-dependent Clp protease ATP-binding subunit ClpA
MPKINVYLPDALADAVRDAQLPVSAICQSALERAVRDVESARNSLVPPVGDERTIGLFARFTPRARQALKLAEEAARAAAHDEVGTEHVLLGVIGEGGNLAIKVLQSMEIEIDDLDGELRASMAKPSATPMAGHIPFSAQSKRALEETAKEALTLGHNYIGCEHVLLGVLAVEDGLGSHVLRRMGLEPRMTRRAVVTALAGFVQAKTDTAPPPAPDTLQQILTRLDAIEKKLAS